MGSLTDGYIGSNGRLLNAYRKRPQDFKRRILFYLPNNDSLFLRSQEQIWLDMIRQEELDHRYYNLKKAALGVAKGTVLTEDHKEKLRILNTGANNAMWGRTQSMETKLKISESQKLAYTEERLEKMRKPKTEAHKEKLRKPKSDEHREKLRQANLGHRLTEATKEKLRGRKHTEEEKARMRIERECPHCGRLGRGSAMFRYHFDNCRQLISS